MSLGLHAPLGLAALAALALPILIHLVRRLELTTIDFAALRWIAERARPRRRIRFERPWLLLVRLLLIAVLALLLAAPVLYQPAASAPAWVVVAPGASLSAARAVVAMPGADWRWLAPGFPSLDIATPPGAVPTASLLRELDAQLPRGTTLTVIVPAELGGLDGERPTLGRAIDWRVVPGRSPDATAPTNDDSFTLAVRYGPDAEPALKYLRASVLAWNTDGAARYTLDAQPQDVALPRAAQALVWLGSPMPPPVRAWIEHGGTALVAESEDSAGEPVWRDGDGKVLARAHALGRGWLVSLAGALAPQTLPALLDADFPRQLLALLRAPPSPPARALAETMRPFHGAAAASVSIAAQPALPLDPWLAALVALLFLVERVLATRRDAPK